GTSIEVPGFGLDLTTVVNGYNALINSNHLGTRLSAGVWLDEANTWAIEGSVFAVLSTPRPYYASGGPGVPAPAESITSLSNLFAITPDQAAVLLSGLGPTSVVVSWAL